MKPTPTDDASRGPRRPFLGWAAVISAPVLAFLLIEGAVRLLGIEPRGGPDAAIPAWLESGIVAKEGEWIAHLSSSPRDLRNYYRTYVWDRHLFYRLRPNLALPLTDVTAPPAIRERTRWIFRTGASGYNTPDFTGRRAPGTLRIVAMGDSSTFGWGVESADAYPRVLEALLRERYPDRAVEVINLGVCGYSSLQGLVLLRREALALDPDVVILSYGSNDYSRVPEPFDEVLRRNEGIMGALRAGLHRSRAYEVWAGFLTARVAIARGSGSREAGVLNVGPGRSRENLEAMVSGARKAGAYPLLVAHCVPGDMSGPMRSAALATGAGLVDAAALLEQAARDIAQGRRSDPAAARYRALYPPQWLSETPRLQVMLTDMCHPNAVGHRAVAEEILARIAPEIASRAPR